MKVSMLSPNLPPAPCGVGDSVAALARALIDAHHRVMLMSVAGGEALAPGMAALKVAGEPWTAARAGSVASLVASEGADLFHYHYVPFLYGRRGVSVGASMLPLLVRRRGVPVVTTLHELAMPWSAQPGSLAAATVQRLQLACIVSASSAVVVTTGHRARVLRRWFPWKAERIHRIPVGATVGPSEGADRTAIRRELGLDDSLVVGFFGTAHPSKNLPLVVRSVDALVSQNVDARLLCIGLEARELRDAAGHCDTSCRGVLDRAVCLGWVGVNDTRIPALLKAIDLLPLPMVDGVSTLRTSVMTAMAHGLPIVGTIGRETDPELYEDGAIVAVPAGKPPEFLQAVADVARDEERASGLSHRAGDLFRRRYAWPHLRSLTEQAYAQALGVRHRAGNGETVEAPGVR